MSFANELKTFPVLTTDRLTLRSMSPDEDAPAYFKHLSAIPDTIWGGLERESVADARNRIAWDLKGFKNKAIIPWGIFPTAGGDLIGFVKLYEFFLQSRAEIGYWMAEGERRKGLMSEAMRAVIAFGFERLELHRIHAYVRTDNAASRGLLKSLGFEHEGVLRQYSRQGGTKENRWRDAEWADMATYSLLQEDIAR